MTWEAAEKLNRLKQSLLPALESLNYTWVIRNNGSNDNTNAMVSGWNNKNIKLIQHVDNSQNFSQGVNDCFNFANPDDEDLVLLLNNDVIFNDKVSIKNMINLLKKDVGVVGARLLYTGTNKLQHCGVVFHPIYYTPFHFRAGQESDKDAEKNREFQACTGAVLLTKAQYFRTAEKDCGGGLDPKFNWAFEDISFNLAVKNNLHKKIVYCGQTNIFHDESHSLKKHPIHKLFMSKNVDRFLTKWKSKYKIDMDIYNKDKNYGLLK